MFTTSDIRRKERQNAISQVLFLEACCPLQILAETRGKNKLAYLSIQFGAELLGLENKRQQTKRHVDWCSFLKKNTSCILLFLNSPTELAQKENKLSGMCLPMVKESILTHQSAESHDSQQSLDQDAEPVRQSSVVAAVGIRLTNVGHVCHFKGGIIQESFHQHDSAIPVHVHGDTEKKTKRHSRRRQKERFLGGKNKSLTLFSLTR